MNIEHIHASEDSEKMVAALQRDGAVIVEDFLDADLLSRFNADVDPLMDDDAAGRVCDVQRLLHVVLRPSDPHHHRARRQVTRVRDRSAHPSALPAICDEILLPSCACYRLNVAQLLDRGPGSPDQLLHRDEAVWPYLPQPHGDVQVASVLALVDFTAENGATRVAPGSHVWDRGRGAEPEELVAR